jgi:metal-dependent amidase/aminoacylase/carboxypeptidase family protein
MGQSAHAALAPEKGINALNAALLGLMGIHAQRETFVEADHVRVHPIITRGGSVVNAVPDDVTIETYVRAANNESLQRASSKVDRALQAGAMAVGASVDIETIPGYLSSRYDANLSQLFRDNAVSLVGPLGFGGPKDDIEGGSSDIGDVCHLLPTLMACSRAWTGHAHSPSYVVKDVETAYILPAKVMAMTAIDLLSEGGRVASAVLSKHTPVMNREDYVAFLRSLSAHSCFPQDTQ